MKHCKKYALSADKKYILIAYDVQTVNINKYKRKMIFNF